MSRVGRRMQVCVPRAAVPLIAVLLGAGTAPLGAQAPAAGNAGDEGQRVFATVCVACHTVGGGARIGPDLQDVTRRRDAEWLRRFIRDPEQVFAAGDSTALALLAQYNTRMPALGLSDAQVASVIAFLGAGDAPAAAAGRPAPFLPTLGLAVLAAVGITLIALYSGTKRVETRA